MTDNTLPAQPEITDKDIQTTLQLFTQINGVLRVSVVIESYPQINSITIYCHSHSIERRLRTQLNLLLENIGFEEESESIWIANTPYIRYIRITQ